jgi:hypothetical protein
MAYMNTMEMMRADATATRSTLGMPFGSVDDNDQQGGLIEVAATGRDDDLSATRNAARGIVVGVVIGVVLWSVWIGFGLWGWYLLSR